MKIVEITNALKSLGWSLSRDEVVIALHPIGCRIGLRISYTV